MSVATLHAHDNNVYTNLISIGSSHSYCFYQELPLNTTSTNSSLRQPKQIIPSIPREHFKAPKNSSLSPIRSQKVMPKTSEDDKVQSLQQQQQQQKRPYPLVTTFSSPASIQTIKKSRQRKVSFNEKVVVVCTIFDEDDIPSTVPTVRRHSTGEPNLKSILVYHHHNEKTTAAQKLTKSLKQFKNRFLFV